MIVGIGIGIPEQHHLAAEPPHGLNFDRRGGHGHDNHRTAAKPLCRQCNPLGMIARRGRNHPF